MITFSLLYQNKRRIGTQDFAGALDDTFFEIIFFMCVHMYAYENAVARIGT